MESIWFKPELSEEVIKNDNIFEKIQSIVADVLSNSIDILQLIENLEGVLTHQEPENREKGMRFLTKILDTLPDVYMNEVQIKFISKFYVDRLKDNHRVIPTVLEGYLTLIKMKHYNVTFCAEFFTNLFKEISCQSQVRQDRYNIYSIISMLIDKNVEYMKTLGPDFVYGVIESMNGERDPRNLLFLFTLLPKFITNIPLGHLGEEMFETISCYYPIDFHPSPDDPAAVTRQDLADALIPCLCATPDFGEQCIVLLIEKLDSQLRQAKIDSLKLLKESCRSFNAETYAPFLKALWSSINREISHKTDEELKLSAHEALSALITKLTTSPNTHQTFETFVKGILLSMQTAIAESTTVAQFNQAARVLLTTANASKESCVFITKMMIPATMAFYEFKSSSPKLQVASLDYLADLYELAAHWDIVNVIEEQAKEIPQQCLIAVSRQEKDFQIAGFRTLIRVIDVLASDLVVPYVEILIHNVQHSQDNDLLNVSVKAVNAIGRKYPELIMSLVIQGKCDLDNLLDDKECLQKRLNLLINLASIDDFTTVVLKEMLKLVTKHDKEAVYVVEALSATLSNSNLYTESKISQVESDHGLISSILTWLKTETGSSPQESLTHGYLLVANTMTSLAVIKQDNILAEHTPNLLELCNTNEAYFLMLECLYRSVHQNVYNQYSPRIVSLALNLSLDSDDDVIRTRACVLTAHFLNKAEHGTKFQVLYDLLKNHLSSCSRDDNNICPRLILLYGWLTKALILRGSDLFLFWLQKITVALASSEYCVDGAKAIQLIMGDNPDHLTNQQHCRVSLLYRQRMFQAFSNLTSKMQPLPDQTQESYLLSWAYVLGKAPKEVLRSEVERIVPLVIDSLVYENEELLLVMMGVLGQFVQSVHLTIGDSLQTILPRLVKLSRHINSMDVRMKSLQCLYDIANSYSTILLLQYKQDILLDLTPALDDKKRLVRNLAVRARTRWFLVGAPGEKKAM